MAIVRIRDPRMISCLEIRFVSWLLVAIHAGPLASPLRIDSFYAEHFPSHTILDHKHVFLTMYRYFMSWVIFGKNSSAATKTYGDTTPQLH